MFPGLEGCLKTRIVGVLIAMSSVHLINGARCTLALAGADAQAILPPRSSSGYTLPVSQTYPWKVLSLEEAAQ